MNEMDSKSPRPVEAADLRRWLAGRQAAALREQQEARRNPMTTAQAVTSALSLFRLTVRLHGWPIPEDPIATRENAEVQATWQRLRRHYGRP
jgi:hypothetical protein